MAIESHDGAKAILKIGGKPVSGPPDSGVIITRDPIDGKRPDYSHTLRKPGKGFSLEESPVVVVMQRMVCSCGGAMRHTGECLASSPPQYPHICVDCGAIENVRALIYPCLQYRVAGEGGLVSKL